MSTRLPKRLVALLLAAMMALIVAPGAAFAEELTSGGIAAQDGDGVLKVYQVTAEPMPAEEPVAGQVTTCDNPWPCSPGQRRGA